MRQLGLPRAFYHAARLGAAELSLQATERSRWLYAWQALRSKGITSKEASETLSLPRYTLYRWQKRLKGNGPRGLEPKSRRPKRVRQPTWSDELAHAVLRLREQYPRWGKDKLAVLLKDEGHRVSASMVGGILAYLKSHNMLKEPSLQAISAKKRKPRRPYATRKPKDYAVKEPGDLVEVDTLDIRPLPGVILKQFSSRDIVSRWDVIEVRTRATANTATEFLHSLKERLPFALRAIQVDGGSEFMAEFEEACQKDGIKLFVLPPHSPKLNGHVERANRVHTEEFWECYLWPLGYDGEFELKEVQPALLAWEKTYNTLRPHQSLSYRTPAMYLRECHPDLIPHLSHIY